jgi:hypothetical protein
MQCMYSVHIFLCLYLYISIREVSVFANLFLHFTLFICPSDTLLHVFYPHDILCLLLTLLLILLLTRF